MNTSARRALWLALTFGAACGEEGRPPALPPAELGVPERITAVEAPARTRPARTEAPLPTSAQRVRDVAFPHDPHVEIACAFCHTSVPGHGSHAAVECRECHVGAGDIPPPPPREAVCLSCHHGEDQPRDCRDCHDPVAPLVTERPMHLGVWDQARERSLPFAHARHESTECTTCHVSGPALAPSRDCGNCHENHHRAEAACAECHARPPEGAHPLEAHLGCGGSGCHADPLVQALPPSPSYCLVCHQDQADHNPGRDCADCHQVRGPPAVARPAPAAAPVRSSSGKLPW